MRGLPAGEAQADVRQQRGGGGSRGRRQLQVHQLLGQQVGRETVLQRQRVGVCFKLKI